MESTRRDVLILDTRNTPLPRAMLDAYLDDLRSWISDLCRAAGNGPALSLVDALHGPCSAPGAFSRWDAIGPHAALRREYGLSRDALAILLVAAAPRLWGSLAHVYAAVTGRVVRRRARDRYDARRSQRRSSASSRGALPSSRSDSSRPSHRRDRRERGGGGSARGPLSAERIGKMTFRNSTTATVHAVWFLNRISPGRPEPRVPCAHEKTSRQRPGSVT